MRRAALSAELITCPADGVWPETPHSTSRLEMPCPVGYAGSMFRSCSLEGAWSEVDDALCSRRGRRR